MMADEVELELACVDRVNDPKGRPVNINRRYLGVQQETCVRQYGHGCEFIVKVNAINLAPRIFSFHDPDHEGDMFSFTESKLMLESTTLLHTDFGQLRCLPEGEYQLWKAAGLCHVAPLVVLLDGVRWRVIASENAKANDKEVIDVTKATDSTFRAFLQAHKEGGQLLKEVKTAMAVAEEDLKEHRPTLFKLFAVIGIPPTLSHDLTKTTLVNFCLGRCFSSEGLVLFQKLVPSEEAWALTRRLHMEVENHHPEHGPRPVVKPLDMYLDRVSRNIQKDVGWNNKAWHILDRYTPDEYKEDFARFEKKYSAINLEDPGDIDIMEKIPGASINLVWEDFYP